MAKSITRIVLTGGPAAGKTTLISRILMEFKREDGWRVITIPESATDLISGFGIKPFDDCVTMEEFQYFVTDDQLHREKLALKGAELVPEEKILIVYDRALLDNKAYITDEQFKKTLAYFGKTEEEVLAGYDAVLHLVTCAKGAEQAYNFGNAARYESVEVARQKDDLTLRSWSAHPRLCVIDNSADFEVKINRAMSEIFRILGQSEPALGKRKYLIAMPDFNALRQSFGMAELEMTQTYLHSADPRIERRIRQQSGVSGYLYFYTEKRTAEDGMKWVTDRAISEKEYNAYLLERDTSLHPVSKTKRRFTCADHRMEIDTYPYESGKAVLFVYGNPDTAKLPEGIDVLRDVTGDPEYKNRMLAQRQRL